MQFGMASNGYSTDSYNGIDNAIMWFGDFIYWCYGIYLHTKTDILMRRHE